MFSRQERSLLKDLAALQEQCADAAARKRMERRTTNYRKVLRSRINKKVRIALNDLTLYQSVAELLPALTRVSK